MLLQDQMSINRDSQLPCLRQPNIKSKTGVKMKQNHVRGVHLLQLADDRDRQSQVTVRAITQAIQRGLGCLGPDNRS